MFKHYPFMSQVLKHELEARLGPGQGKILAHEARRIKGADMFYREHVLAETYQGLFLYRLTGTAVSDEEPSESAWRPKWTLSIFPVTLDELGNRLSLQPLTPFQPREKKVEGVTVVEYPRRMSDWDDFRPKEREQ